jgi:ferrous iron transport protein A
LMSLSMARPGERATILEIRGGRGLRGRLANLGLLPGVEIEVISNRPGPLIIKRGAARLGLGHGMAHRILVSLVPNPKMGGN